MGASLAAYAILCLKQPKGKNPHPARAGRSPTTAHSLGRKRGKMVSPEGTFLARTAVPSPALFNAILSTFGSFSLSEPSAERRHTTSLPRFSNPPCPPPH